MQRRFHTVVPENSLLHNDLAVAEFLVHIFQDELIFS